MKGNAYTIFFAAMLGIVCSLMLTGVAESTKGARERNKVAEKNRNIFKSLGIEFDEKASSERLTELFENKIVKEESPSGIELYKHQEEGITKGIAVQFEGSGLWGPIKGFLALEPDMKTIKGVTFYEQEETPGLGGDIATEGFTSRFTGKKIVDNTGDPGIIIKTGLSDPAQNEIDGISGATMTVDKVSQMLNKVIEKIAAGNPV